jgi:ABC-type lipoprotein release transport system permease subunit
MRFPPPAQAAAFAIAGTTTMGLVGAVLGLAIGLGGAYLVYLRFSAARSLQQVRTVTNHHRPSLTLNALIVSLEFSRFFSLLAAGLLVR